MNINIDEMKRLNPKHEPHTPEKLRELSGLDLSDEQAEDVIWSIRKFAHVLCQFAITHEQLPKAEDKSVRNL